MTGLSIRALKVIEVAAYGVMLAGVAGAVVLWLMPRKDALVEKLRPSSAVVAARISLPEDVDVAAKRDIFSSAVAFDQAAFTATTSAAPGGLPPNVRVAGIMLGAVNQVILEDTSAHRSYFVKEGDAPDAAPCSIARVQGEQVTLLCHGSSVTVRTKEPQAAFGGPVPGNNANANPAYRNDPQR